jgi:predicted nucleic acid-binding protein
LTTIVVDASVVVEVVTSLGPGADRARAAIADQRLAAPALMPFEAANVLRREAARGIINADAARIAHGRLLELPVQLWPHALLAERAWELRANATIYDATYLALAELLEVPLLTLDEGLATVPGIRCEVWVP